MSELSVARENNGIKIICDCVATVAMKFRCISKEDKSSFLKSLAEIISHLSTAQQSVKFRVNGETLEFRFRQNASYVHHFLDS